MISMTLQSVSRICLLAGIVMLGITAVLFVYLDIFKICHILLGRPYVSKKKKNISNKKTEKSDMKMSKINVSKINMQMPKQEEEHTAVLPENERMSGEIEETQRLSKEQMPDYISFEGEDEEETVVLTGTESTFRHSFRVIYQSTFMGYEMFNID